jgi:hypothetical protein
LISPTGNIAIDSLAHVVNRAAESWQHLPNQTPAREDRCRLTIRPEANISIHLQLYKHLPSEQADKIWAQASREYASNANGDTNLFMRGARQDWVFRTTEEPILKSGGQVTKWVYHF